MTPTPNPDRRIGEMPAGPELDRLVAERVMGWRLDGSLCIKPNGDWWDYGNPLTGIWSPSTNIAHAWEVADAIAGTVRDGKEVEVVIELMGKQHGAVARAHLVDEEGRGAREIAMVVADTAPLAICRAALLATSPNRPTGATP